jgi:hypothetical protein
MIESRIIQEMPCELTVCIAREKSPVWTKTFSGRLFVKIHASAHSIIKFEPKHKGICANSPQGIYFREIKALAIPTIDFLMKQLVFTHIHSQGIYSSENSVSVIEKLFDVLRPVIILM